MKAEETRLREDFVRELADCFEHHANLMKVGKQKASCLSEMARTTARAAYDRGFRRGGRSK